MPTITEIAQYLMPLFPFFFVLLHEVTDRAGSRIMFGLMAAVTSMFMSFEIATSIDWLSLVYFALAVGMGIKVIVDYDVSKKKEVKR